MKTLAISKLVFICSVINTRKDFSKEINKVAFDFIWNPKPAKLEKKDTLITKQKAAGGLAMKDFSPFDKAFKKQNKKLTQSSLAANLEDPIFNYE